MKTIVFTGGGSAGHITPNIAIIEALQNKGYRIEYIGMSQSMEKDLISQLNISFHEISGGKLRRYFDFKNVTDLLRILKGFVQSLSLMHKIKPDLVFSKGGFVSCPVVWAAWLKRIPVIIHESDMTPGLANRLAIPFCKKVCCSFPKTLEYLPRNKGVYTGLPVRQSMLNGSKEEGLLFCNLTRDKPVIVLTGGSQGSKEMNDLIRSQLSDLLKEYQICHICGKGHLNSDLEGVDGYRQFEYVNEELPNIFAMADLIISRAGATTLFEILTLKKLNILIPLSAKVSRGDQILNALSFEASGYSHVVLESDQVDLKAVIRTVFLNKDTYLESMRISCPDSTTYVIKEIEKYIK